MVSVGVGTLTVSVGVWVGGNEPVTVNVGVAVNDGVNVAGGVSVAVGTGV